MAENQNFNFSTWAFGFAGHLSSSLCHLVRLVTQVQLLEIHEIHDQMSYKKMKFQSFFEVEYYIIKVHRILIIC